MSAIPPYEWDCPWNKGRKEVLSPEMAHINHISYEWRKRAWRKFVEAIEDELAELERRRHD